MIDLPPLRPFGRHMAYVHELRAISKSIEPQLRDDVAEIKAVNEGKVTVAQIGFLALKYRLKLGAMFELLEDLDLLKCGTYNHIKYSRMVYGDGSEGRFAPLRVLWEVITRHGLPDAAPGCEGPKP